MTFSMSSWLALLAARWVGTSTRSSPPTCYRPAEHADPFLRAWLEVAGSSVEGAALFEALTLDWTGAEASSGSSLTRFSHVAHFASPAENACLECHELPAEAPGFTPLSLDACTRCHNARGASTGCTTCHAYHAFSPSRAVPGATLDVLRRWR